MRKFRTNSSAPHWKRSCAAGLLAFLGLASVLPAQPQQAPPMPSPRLLIVSPAGGQAGTSVEVVLTGQELEDPQGLLFSHSGIKAELLAAPKPPAVESKKPPAKPQKPMPPILTTRFKITIPADTPLGTHDLRVFNKWGVSNPRAFVVGDLPQHAEMEPNNDVPEAQRINVNTTIYGAIGVPTDVDYYTFAGKKGQRVVVSCRASSIDSRLSAALQFLTSNGTLLASNRKYDGEDALMDATLLEDGDYFVRVFSFTYTQGTAEHFYRLTVTTAPWIDAVFPPMVQPGKPALVTVYGRNLPGGQPDPSAVLNGRILDTVKVKVNVSADAAALSRLNYPGHVSPNATSLDGQALTIKGPGGMSNPYLLTYAQAPVVLDNGDNDTPEKAQPVAVPCEIGGRIDAPRDRDWYSFTAKKGDTFSIEAFGDRIGSAMDIYYTLRRWDGKQPQAMGEFDDNPEILNPTQFFTRTDDPARQRFVAPEDASYQLMISSREASLQAGPRHLYRLRITRERPDFHLVLMPPTPNSPEACLLGQGGRAYLNVYVWRLDGFNGPITLTAEGLPPGVTCAPQVIGSGVRQTALVLQAAANAAAWTGAITIKGTAAIDGKPQVREARGATITWLAVQNQVTVSRMDRSIVLAVRDKAAFTLTATKDKIESQLGDKVSISLKIGRLWPDAKGQIAVTALGLPANVVLTANNQPVNLPAGKDDATLPLDVRPTAIPGTYTFVLRAAMPVPFNKDPMSKQRPNVTVVQPSTPITLTILPKQVATFALTPAKPVVKMGQQTEFIVKATRMYDYTGPIKVELVIPPAAKGLSAEPVTIPAGKDEVRMILKADPKLAPGNKPNLTLKATVEIKPKTVLTHEVKLSADVIK